MDSREIYKVIGLMSGTSLDGLDIAYCVFKKENGEWQHSIKQATTIRYTPKWTKGLAEAHKLSAEDLLALDAAYGKFLGSTCFDFMRKHKIKPDFIASHGHTVFHQPKNGFTYQVGNGNVLHAVSGIPVIWDFRSLDVALGGQGAPLVPAGDKILFSEFDVCLNLGGIANLSHDVKGKRKAFDICFANMSTNYLVSKSGKPFDRGGQLASSGEVNQKMLKALSRIYSKYRLTRPSMGREIFEKEIKPLLDTQEIPLYDRLRTCVESTALEIIDALPLSKDNLSVLCTGGGAYNSFLILTLLDKCNDNISFVMPEDEVIKFKEALIFAFLGVLRVTGEVNCLHQVTGATRSSSGGIKIGF
jgi:anhydro-N-acetylmuramic acid kinase